MFCGAVGDVAGTREIKFVTEREPQDIRKRAYQYALRAIRLHQFLQKQRNSAGWLIGKQYLRSATSIGANIEEAQGSESRADFVHKLGIAQKEAPECLFWLRLLADSRILPNARLKLLTRETNELIAVITTIVVNTKSRRPA